MVDDVNKPAIDRLKKGAMIIGGFLFFAGVLIASGLVYLNSERGRKYLANTLSDTLSSPETIIEIEDINGSLFSVMDIPSLVVSDKNGKWLEVRNILIDWSPTALIGKVFHARDIKATTVIISRTPESDTPRNTEKKEPFSLPILPIDIEIDHYGIENILTGKEVIDAAPDFTLGGMLNLAREEGIAAQFELTGNDQHRDMINIDVSYPQNGSTLSLAFNVSAPENGLLAKLSGLSLGQDTRFELSGEGPLNDWQGKTQITLGNTEISNWAINNKETGFSLTSNTNPRPLLPEELHTVAGSEFILNLNLAPADETGKRVLKSTISNDNVVMDITSGISLADTVEIGETTVLLETINVSPINELITPAYIEPIEITATLADILTTPILNLKLRDGKLGVKGQVSLTLDGDINAAIEDQNIKISTDGDITNMTGDAVGATGDLLKSAIHWNIEGSYEQQQAVITADTIHIEHDEFDTKGTAKYGSKSGALEVNVTSSHPNLASTLEKLGIDFAASGAMDIRLDAKQENTSSPLETRIAINTRDLSTDDELINQILGTGPTLHGEATQQQNGAVKFNSLTVDAGLLAVRASGSLSAEQVFEDTTFIISLQDLATLSNLDGPAIDGKIDIEGALSGALSSPALDVSSALNTLNLQGLSLSNFKTEASFTDLSGDLRGQIKAQSDSNFGALRTEISLAKEDEKLSLPTITAELGKYSLSGNLLLPANNPVSGEISVMTTISPQQQTIVDGDIALSLSFMNKDNTQQIIIDGSMNDIYYTPDPSTILSMEKAEIKGDILLLDERPQISLIADIYALNHPQISSKHASLNIDQQDQNIGYLFSIEGTDAQPYELELTGDIIPATDGSQLATATLSGTVNNTPITFNHEGNIRISENRTELPAFTIGLGNGQINGSVVSLNDEIDAEFTVQNADLRPFMVLYPEIQLSGILNGSGAFQGNQKDVLSEFDLTLSEIIFTDKTGIGPDDLSISVSGNVNNTQSVLTGHLTYPGEFDANFDIVLPLTTETINNNISLTQDEPLSGEILWTGEISPLWPALKLIDHDLSGNLDGELQMSGTIKNPDIDGTLSLTSGRYENMQTGFVASDIDLSASIKDRVLTLTRFSANDGEDGTISANAEVTLNTDYSFDARSELFLQSAKLVRQPELSIEATTDLLFQKSKDMARLSGNIVVDSADIGAIEQSGPSVTTLNVDEINGEGIIANNEPEEDALGPVDLDLKLQVPGKLFVRSFGLNSEWKADLSVTGTSEAPIIAGTAEQIRGYFEFSGKRFELTRGSFSFPGNQTNDPIIEIAAEHQLTDMVANLRIYGLASNPSLEMSSTPYLPENEVMARILFGTSVADLTATEAVQLASAVHSLSNGGGQGIMGGIRRAIGVDRLSIDNDASREYGTTITGGKYIADNVYVEVSTAPATGQTATSVEVGLTRSLSLVTRRTLDHDNNLSIRWSWDY